MQEVMRHLLAFTQCVSVVADIPLCQKSSLHVRAELRSKLATALQQGEKERAFAKSCGFSGKPIANDPEAMMRAYPGIHDIDYSAKPVTSGLNVSLWKFWNARHCVRCTQTEVHKDCYFKPLLHFLNTGFEPPVRRGFDLFAAQPSRVAYVDKWREEEARLRVYEGSTARPGAVAASRFAHMCVCAAWPRARVQRWTWVRACRWTWTRRCSGCFASRTWTTSTLRTSTPMRSYHHPNPILTD